LLHVGGNNVPDTCLPYLPSQLGALNLALKYCFFFVGNLFAMRLAVLAPGGRWTQLQARAGSETAVSKNAADKTRP